MIDAEDILENRENIVPIIGENCFYYYSEDGDKIPLQEFVIDKIIENQHLPEVSYSLIQQMKNRGFYGLTLCRQQCGFSCEEEFIKCYRNIIRKHKMSIHLDEIVRSFLLRYNFKLVITTCCFDFLENELPQYCSRHYLAASGANNNEDIRENTPTIYHILGLCDKSGTWAWDEESLMYILHCHHNDDLAPNGLRRYLSTDPSSSKAMKALLVLYSNLPDWLFRFFLYPLAYNDKAYKKWSNGYYFSSQNNEEDSLKNFIKKVICYDIEDNRVEEVLCEATKLLPERCEDTLARTEHKMAYDIFISHAVEDKDEAIKIKKRLENEYGLKVWLDINGGIEDGSYTVKMKEGLENSAYYMPLITAAFVKKLKNGVCNEALTLEEVLQDDGKMAYVQKEALAANIIWARIKRDHPHRKAYSLPVLFPDAQISYDTIKLCSGTLKQLPEDLFREQTIFNYEGLFIEKDWSRYKTIEN